jgi:8-oxo-dGTP diphosphatase
MRGDEALFILRRGPHRKGCWGLVGGHLEHGESPQDAAARECLEEVGVDLHPELIVPGPFTNDVFEAEGRHSVTLWLSAELPAGQVTQNREPHKAERVAWFRLDALPRPLFLPVVNFLRQPVRPPFDRASPPHGIRR